MSKLSSATGSAKKEVQGYVSSLQQTPSLFWRRVFLTKTFDQMVQSAQLSSVNPMKRTLGPVVLTLLCIGHMIGGGIFILTGLAAKTEAGPAVTLSYVVGGLVAGCTALTYCELAASYPLAGGSFNYVLGIWGEGPAWITIVSIAVDALLGAGSLARGWSSYLASLCNYGGANGFTVQSGSYQLDFVAFGFMILLTIIVAAGTQQTSWINTFLKVTNLVIIVLVLAFTFPHANTANWSPYFPFGARGVFEGAALIFFAYGGYNASANLAEEAINPRKDVPFSIVVAMGVCTTLYVLMCMAITLAKPYYLIDANAPFSVLFKTIPGWHWASYLVAVGAVIGVGTVVLVSLLTTTREFLVMSRHNLIPQWLAHVNPVTGTPIRIIVLYGFVSACIALCTDFETLAKLTNVGALFVVVMVGGVTLWRRYTPPIGSDKLTKATFFGPFVRLAALVTLSIVFTALWGARVPWGFYLGFGLAVIASALSFYTLPQVFKPEGFSTPIVPWTCGFCIFGGIFLMGSAGGQALWRFGIVIGVCVATYLLYGVHASNRHDKELEEHFTRLPGENVELESIKKQEELHNYIAGADEQELLDR